MNKEELIDNILDGMKGTLNKKQLNELRQTLETEFDNHKDYTHKSNMELVDDFCRSKKDEGLSSSSIKAYRYEVVRFLDYVNMDVREVTKANVKEYLSNYRYDNDVSDVTLNNMRRDLSSFFSWLVNEEIIQTNCVKKLSSVKERKKVKQSIKEYDLEVLKDNVSHLRDRAILEVLDCTGMRVSEICSLNRYDIDDGVAVITGKGNKEREVYFSDRCMYYVNKYLKTRKDRNPALFVNINKSSDGTYHRVSRHSIEIMVKALGDRNNINEIHPHAFRRTTCTRLLSRNMPLQEVQELMGHSQVSTTILYNNNNRHSVRLHTQLLV